MGKVSEQLQRDKDLMMEDLLLYAASPYHYDYVTEMSHKYIDAKREQEYQKKKAQKITATECREAYNGTGNPQSAISKQVAGNHYQMPIQPIEFITKNNIPYIEGNIIKYIVRHKAKNGKEDLLKAQHYLEMLIEEYK